MPFDKILIKMHLRGLYQNGLSVMYRAYKQMGKESIELASAEQQLLFVYQKAGKTRLVRIAEGLKEKILRAQFDSSQI